MGVISREAFLAPAAVPAERVPLPEFGEDSYVNVHGMTAKARSQFEQQFQTKGGKQSARRLQEVRQRLLVACCKDDDGQPIFTVEDIEAIGGQSSAVVERIVNVAMRLCGMKEDDIETLAGN